MAVYKFTSVEFDIAHPGIADEIKELAPSPSENHGSDAFTAVVKLKVPWNSRYDITDDIVGRQLTYPRTSLVAGVIAQNASIRPFSKKNNTFFDGVDFSPQLLGYEEAELTINYSSDTASGGGGGSENTYTESLTPSGEFQTIPNKGLYWETGKKSPVDKGSAPGILVIGFDYSVTRYRLSAIPNAVLTDISHCNQSAVQSATLGLTFPIETILFVGSTSSRQVQSGGESLWTNTCSFSYRKQTWNKFYRPEANDYVFMKKADGSNFKPIPLANFSDLVSPTS